MIISPIGEHKVYCDTHALLSSTKSQIYDKEKGYQSKAIILYKSAIKLDTFLFDPTNPKMGHIQVGHAKIASTYVHVVGQ